MMNLAGCVLFYFATRICLHLYFSSHQWAIIEQVSSTLCSLDAKLSSVQSILNTWQRRISAVMVDGTSTRSCSTQTCDELSDTKLQENQRNRCDSVSSKQQKKRFGIKKRISALLGIRHPAKDTISDHLNSEFRKPVKRAASKLKAYLTNGKSTYVNSFIGRNKLSSVQLIDNLSNSPIGPRMQPVSVSSAHLRIRRSTSGAGRAASNKTKFFFNL